MAQTFSIRLHPDPSCATVARRALADRLLSWGESSEVLFRAQVAVSEVLALLFQNCDPEAIALTASGKDGWLTIQIDAEVAGVHGSDGEDELGLRLMTAVTDDVSIDIAKAELGELHVQLTLSCEDRNR